MRKASMLDTPEWLAVTAKAAKTDPYVALIDICICIPRLLERTDKLARVGAPASEFEGCSRKLGASNALANSRGLKLTSRPKVQ